MFGVDFNPAADKLRVVSNTGQNLRVERRALGAVAAVDTALAYDPTTYDAAVGGTPPGPSGGRRRLHAKPAGVRHHPRHHRVRDRRQF